MKILHIITKSNWGGAQRYVFDLALNSKERGQEMMVALGGSGILKDKLETAGIKTRPISNLGRDMDIKRDASSFKDISKIIRSEKPDILHLHSPKAAGIGSFFGRIWGVKKIVYTVHGWPFNENRPLHEKVAIAFFSWLTMIFSTHVILLSEKELGQAQMFPLVSPKLRLIPIGMTEPRFLSQKEARAFLQTKTQESLDKKIVLGTIAELHRNKGHIYSIQAIKQLIQKFPSLVFLILSEGEEREHLQALIKEKELEKNIMLVGHIDNASQYLKAFSIFLFPSLKEGLPYALMEAGFAGLPVIATTVGGIPEIVDDMKSGILIQPKKSDEIAHAIEFLLEHKSTQKEYGEALREKVSRKFSLEKMLESIFKLYKE